MFRSNTSYQLAMALLVLFVAYVVHMQHRPYMTHVAAGEVVAEHRRKALTDPRHRAIEARLRAGLAAAREREAALARSGGKGGDSGGGVDDDSTSSVAVDAGDGVGAGGAIDKKKKPTAAGASAAAAAAARSVAGRMKNAAELSRLARLGGLLTLTDYNFAEGLLLASAVLVNLAGLMFDSSRFNGAYASRYQGEYDSLSLAVVVVIFASVAFWAVCLGVDVLLASTPCGRMSTSSRARARSRSASKLGAAGVTRVLGAAGAGDAAPAAGKGTGVGVKDEQHVEFGSVNPLRAALAGDTRVGGDGGEDDQPGDAEGALGGGAAPLVTREAIEQWDDAPPPTGDAWTAVRVSSIDLAARLEAAQLELQAARRAAARADAAGPRDGGDGGLDDADAFVASNPMRVARGSGSSRGVAARAGSGGAGGAERPRRSLLRGTSSIPLRVTTTSRPAVAARGAIPPLAAARSLTGVEEPHGRAAGGASDDCGRLDGASAGATVGGDVAAAVAGNVDSAAAAASIEEATMKVSLSVAGPT